MDSVTVGQSVLTLNVSPRGDWAYQPVYRPLIGILFRIESDGSLFETDRLDDELYSSFFSAVRPDSDGLIIEHQETEDSPFYAQYYSVTASYELVAKGASQEIPPYPNWIGYRTITQQGLFTVISRWTTRYRVGHLDPGGDLGPPSTATEYASNDYQYYPQADGVSRDGRLFISAGAGSLCNAISLRVNDDGSLSEVDRLPPSDLCHSNVGNVLISPRRDWVLFHGDWTELWDLNSDGSFGDRRWVCYETTTAGRGADISGDGRVAIVYHYAVYVPNPGQSISILRLSPEGDLLSIRRHWVGYFAENLAFITRRRPGDVNGDGWIDVADLVALVNHLRLGTEIPNPVDLDNADVNRDTVRNDADIAALVEMLLSGT